jgi:paraquat-inducible protein B
MVYFDESISGLDEGSPVKLRGVRVGHVVGISIRYDKDTGKSLAAVLCELNRARSRTSTGPTSTSPTGGAPGARRPGPAGPARGRRPRDRAPLRGARLHGPAQVPGHEQGDRRQVRGHPLGALGDLRVPASAATMANATALLARMQQIDFKGLSDELKKLVVEARLRIDGVDFKGLAAQWKKTGESIDALARSPDTCGDGEPEQDPRRPARAIGRLDTQVDSNGKDLQATLVRGEAALESFNAAAQSARGFINAQQGFGRTRPAPWRRWPTPPSRSSSWPISSSAIPTPRLGRKQPKIKPPMTHQIPAAPRLLAPCACAGLLALLAGCNVIPPPRTTRPAISCCRLPRGPARRPGRRRAAVRIGLKAVRLEGYLKRKEMVVRTGAERGRVRGLPALGRAARRRDHARPAREPAGGRRRWPRSSPSRSRSTRTATTTSRSTSRCEGALDPSGKYSASLTADDRDLDGGRQPRVVARKLRGSGRGLGRNGLRPAGGLLLSGRRGPRPGGRRRTSRPKELALPSAAAIRLEAPSRRSRGC